ncbi:MAG: hypothetical protein Q7V53_07225 [Caldisericota bacterium]|nr:hypothetical protein [Caldisericota bacterium]
MAILDTTAWGTAENDPAAPAPAKAKTRTGFVDGVKATWAQESIWEPSLVRSVTEYPYDASFDYKEYQQDDWSLVAGARNKEHAENILSQAKKERANREIMDNQHWALGIATDMTVGLTNPLNYIGLGPAKTIGTAALKGAAGAVIGTAATEPLLHSRQVTRTWEESALNVAGAAILGAPLGAGAKGISNKLGTGSWSDTPPTTQPTQLNESIQQGYGADSIGAARAANRNLMDSKVARLPEWMTRFALLGDLTRSANQRLSTSSFQSSRNAVNLLARQNLATSENLSGVANTVPVEIGAGQRNAELTTSLITANESLESMWIAKVKNGTYDTRTIISELKRLDPTVGDDYKVTPHTYRKLMKHYMADAEGFGLQMDEVTLGVKNITGNRQGLEADSIDWAMVSKDKLIDIATNERVIKPENSIDAVQLKKLRSERAAFAEELTNAKQNKLANSDINAIKTAIADHDAQINVRMAALEKRVADYESLVPSSKTHKLGYDDGSYYMSRVPDKGKILANRAAWEQALIRGWVERNGIDTSTPDVYAEKYLELRIVAQRVTDKLLGDDFTVSMGELQGSMDLPANIFKDRTLAVDDRHVVAFMHDDVVSTELYYYSQATVDLELAKSGVKFDDLIRGVQDEFNQRVEDVSAKITDPKKKAEAIRELGVEKDKDIEQLKYVMNRLKRKGGGGDITSNSFTSWVNRANKVAGTAQLGSSAVPTSLGDIASVGRNFGHARTTWNIIRATFDSDFRKDIMANAKEMGVLSALINQQVRDMHLNELANQSLDPNQGFKSVGLQRLDHGLDKVVDVFGKASMINIWAKSGRAIASVSATQNIIHAVNKGWKSLDATSRMDFAKFYLDEDMFDRIGKQLKAHADNAEGIRFAGVEKWDDAEAVRVFKASVYAATEHALNLPSVGTGSKWQNDTLAGRVFMRFKSFNNAAHESTFLAALQNREVSRVVTGTLNYSFWGFASLYTYDAITGRETDMDKYFGDGEAMQKTAWKVLTRTGVMASAQDAFHNASKLAGSDISPLAEEWRSIFPKGLEDELFPKFEDLSTPEKLFGPTYGWASKAVSGISSAIGDVIHGEAPEKNAVAGIRSSLPGQNIAWLRRGIDYVEEFLGGRKADRFADQ